jgi:DNA-directed RNA polymerase specialized sigma54-like protein
LTGKEVQQVLTRVSNLTSHQIADRILATDLAVALDSIGYFNRRVSSADKRAESMSSLSGHSAGNTQNA